MPSPHKPYFSDEENDEDVEIEQFEHESTNTSSIPDPYDHVYSNIPEETHMLENVPNCKHCGAKRFHKEPPGFCCRDGKIKLSEPYTPPELMRLWTANDSDARHFRDSIRFFNGHFSFTSLRCKLDMDTINIRKTSVHTFRAHGQMYHDISSFSGSRLAPEHLEMYFYDDDPSQEHRYHLCRKEKYQQDQQVIEQLVHMLQDNPYSKEFRQMGQFDDLTDYRITLNLDQHMDQRTYNAPISS